MVDPRTGESFEDSFGHICADAIERGAGKGRSEIEQMLFDAVRTAVSTHTRTDDVTVVRVRG